MFKEVVGTISALSVMVGALGMGYPQEKENQQDNAYLVYSEAVTSRMAEQVSATGPSLSEVQAHCKIC